MAKIGKVVQVIGPVVDVEFDEKHLPAIYNAVRIVDAGRETGIPVDVICEVQQHLGENRVRTVAMEPTDGMVRGMRAEDTGEAITVPVGEATLGRVINVVGKAVDKLGDIEVKERWPIHREAPSFEDQFDFLDVALNQQRMQLGIGARREGRQDLARRQCERSRG